MQKNILAIILLVILISSCLHSTKKPNLSVNGTWESIGSGWVLQIENSTEYSFYDITSISCLPNRKGSFKELEKSLTLKNDTLNLLKGVITYQFIKTEKLPELCAKLSDKQKNKSPIFNFEVFAETVREHYAFFELNNINWNQIYRQQKEKLTENSSDVELYQIIEETLELLNDNHAYLEVTDEVYTELEKQSNQEQKEEIGSQKLPEYGDFQVAQMVANHHLKEEMTKDSWLIQWGKLTDNIGYIQVKAMWLFADMEIPKKLKDDLGYVDAYVETANKIYEGNYIQKEVVGVVKIMDRVMKDLSEVESFVIDIRFNGGGQDAVAFEILSRFIPQKLQVATQKLRYGNKFSSILPLYIQGTKDTFSKPIYVLISQQSGSAAEAFAIASMAMQNVKRIGSPTEGAMSTALQKTLPNGWRFSISNEIYMDNQGNNYENIGIPVDYDLNYAKDRQTFFRSVVNDLEKDKRNILKSIDSLKRQ